MSMNMSVLNSKILFLTSVTLIIVSLSVANSAPTYFVPKPIFTVYRRGFEVSIPDDGSIQLFAFHGKVNEPMDGLEAGTFSKDILKKNSKGLWVYKNRRTFLQEGDIIYYWLFVTRDNLGYRYDDGVYTVKEITPRPNRFDSDSDDRHPEDQTEIVPSPPNGISCPLPPKAEPKPFIYDVLLSNLTYQLIETQKDMKTLHENNKIYEDIINKLPNGKQLSFSGEIPHKKEDAKYAAINILRNILNIKVAITSAEYNEDRSKITFNVAELEDKVNIIKRKDKFANSRIWLNY